MNKCIRIDDNVPEEYCSGKQYEYKKDIYNGEITYTVYSNKNYPFKYDEYVFNRHFIDIKKLRENKLERILK